jgi:hypothetical protein
MLKDALQQFTAVSHSTEIYRRSGIAATDVVSCLTIYMALEVVSCARSEGGRGKLTVTPARIWNFDYGDKGAKADVDFSVDLGHKTRKWKVVVEATSPSLF